MPFDPRTGSDRSRGGPAPPAKLDEYYAGEGARDSIVISFQRGDYIPRFVHVSGGADRRAKPEKPATIVIVEDERVVAKDLENRVRSLGYSVVGSAPSGEAALECIDNFHPDIVLMDIVLAGAMRGTEAARLIWNHWRIPVVYLTAFSDAVVLEEIKGSEPYGYILKPFEPKQVHAVLQLALSRRAKEIAANGGLTPDRTWRQALISRLENAPTRTWQWIIKDERVPWPKSAERHPNPKLVRPSCVCGRVSGSSRTGGSGPYHIRVQRGYCAARPYRDCIQEEKRFGRGRLAHRCGLCDAENGEGVDFNASASRSAPRRKRTTRI